MLILLHSIWYSKQLYGESLLGVGPFLEAVWTSSNIKQVPTTTKLYQCKNQGPDAPEGAAIVWMLESCNTSLKYLNLSYNYSGLQTRLLLHNYAVHNNLL
jgi:hypothetical protein